MAMDFKTVLSSLIKRFNEQDVRYGLMGGFALGLWGVARATVDIDFLIDRRDMGKADGIMKNLGYAVKFSSDNVTQYASPVAIFGEVDFLHAFREATMGMLAQAAEKQVFGGEFKIRVLLPEDIIGHKMPAIKNDPSRRAIDLADIKALVDIRGEELDWKAVEKYAVLLDARDILTDIRR